MAIKQSISTIQRQHTVIANLLADMKNKQRSLKKVGLEYGKPSYKGKNQLRLVRGAIDDKPREFVYIGTDPAKQKAALDAIDRTVQFENLGKRIRQMETALTRLTDNLDELAQHFKGII